MWPKLRDNLVWAAMIGMAVVMLAYVDNRYVLASDQVESNAAVLESIRQLSSYIDRKALKKELLDNGREQRRLTARIEGNPDSDYVDIWRLEKQHLEDELADLEDELADIE